MSNINYLSINENFPVPGEDNDTQVFRDNFDTIKTSLRLAKEEVTDLQDNSARTDLDNDFNRKIISRAVFQDNYERKIDLGNIDSGTSTLFVDYENGSYQVVEISGSNKNVSFINFPTDTTVPASVGKVTLEIYGDETSELNFVTSGGTVLKKSADFPNPLIINSPNVGTSGNPVIIEVWQHRSDRIFINYIGQFES